MAHSRNKRSPYAYLNKIRLMWGRGDLNPGSPAPQAGILVQSRGSGTRIHAFPSRPDTLTRRRPRRLDEDVRKLSIEFMVIKV